MCVCVCGGGDEERRDENNRRGGEERKRGSLSVKVHTTLRPLHLTQSVRTDAHAQCRTYLSIDMMT
jgi:hypothetical protein